MYTLYKFHFLNGISEINQLFDDILIIWPAPVYIHLYIPFSFRIFWLSEHTQAHVLYSFRCLILVFQVPMLLWCWPLCPVSSFRWRQKLYLPNCFRDLSSVWFLDSHLILKTRELCGPRVEWSATLDTAHRTCLRHVCGNSYVLMPAFIILYSSSINHYKGLINSQKFYSCPKPK